MEAVLTRFGARLREVRKTKDVSQEDLASDSGVARSYLSGVERGKRNIALVNICRLAVALDVHPSELLSFDPSGTVKSPTKAQREDL